MFPVYTSLISGHWRLSGIIIQQIRAMLIYG